MKKIRNMEKSFRKIGIVKSCLVLIVSIFIFVDSSYALSSINIYLTNSAYKGQSQIYVTENETLEVACDKVSGAEKYWFAVKNEQTGTKVENSNCYTNSYKFNISDVGYGQIKIWVGAIGSGGVSLVQNQIYVVVFKKADNLYSTWKVGSKTIYYIKATPDKIAVLQNPSGNISSSSYANAINGGFFGLGSSNYPYCVSSIAVTNNQPVYNGYKYPDGNYEGGRGWGNTTKSGTLIYDKSLNRLSVVEITTAKEIADRALVSNLDNYYAIGGQSWTSYWKCPNSGGITGRTAIVYDNQSNLYLTVTPNMTAFEFYNAVNSKVNVVNGIHLDGSGSSQLKYNFQVICSGDRRRIPVVIGVQY